MALDIGRIAYQAHSDHVSEDKLLPKWENVGKVEQDAWRLAACAVLDYIHDCESNREKVLEPSPSSTTTIYYPESESWVIQLSKYHRDNLVWLFNAIGYPYGNAVKPFDIANTGDWVGEISQMLAKPNGSYVLDKDDKPNISIEDLKKNIDFWLKHKDDK